MSKHSIPVTMICTRCKQELVTWPTVKDQDTIVIEVNPCKRCEETTKALKTALRNFLQ